MPLGFCPDIHGRPQSQLLPQGSPSQPQPLKSQFVLCNFIIFFLNRPPHLYHHLNHHHFHFQSHPLPKVLLILTSTSDLFLPSKFSQSPHCRTYPKNSYLSIFIQSLSSSLHLDSHKLVGSAASPMLARRKNPRDRTLKNILQTC